MNHQRYHFQERYYTRKIFKINYYYYPYKKISQNLSYKENAWMIYNTTGMLNLTKFEYYFYKGNITLKF